MVSIGSQFSTGDQGSNKLSFWSSGYKTCQGCSAKDTIKGEDHVAGCRYNGDAYGTTVFKCQDCGWKTSFQYDEASDVYYYETRDYKERLAKAKEPPHPWAGVHMSTIGLGPTIISKLGQYQIQGPDLYDMNERKLKALGLTRNESGKVMAAIENQMKTDQNI